MRPDISMLVLGGSLKRRERVSARLGDVLSMLYLASATLKRFEDDGRQEADLRSFTGPSRTRSHRAADALHGVFRELPRSLVGHAPADRDLPARPALRAAPDALGHEVARLLIAPSATATACARACSCPRPRAIRWVS